MSKNIQKTKQSVFSKKRTVKRIEILDTAACQMNEFGTTTVSINGIAQSVGLSRNALYYYFKDRMELITACYERSVSVFAVELEEAMQISDKATEQISFLLRQKLLSDQQEQAILSDLDSVPEPRKSEILTIYYANVAKLELIIQQGIDTNELKNVDPAITAQILLGLLSWTQLWKKWHEIDENIVEATIQTLLKGVCADRDRPFSCHINVQNLLGRQINLFDSASLGEAKRLQLLGEAALLFNQRGIGSTSLDDIADRIGATKGSIYHYFKDKQSLVDSCYENSFEQYALIAKTAQEIKGPGAHRFLTILHLNCQAQALPTPPLIVQAGILNLSKDYIERSLKLAKIVDTIKIDALNDGSCRADLTTLQLTAGLIFWIPKWIKDKPEIDGLQLADAICQITSGGIVNTN
jgi:AcrR family transcriptional regulator